MRPDNKKKRSVFLSFILVSIAIPALTAPPASGGSLNDIPGLSPAQAAAAAGSQQVYEDFLAFCGPAAPSQCNLSIEQEALYEEVTELVHTANEQQGSGPTQRSLGLDEEGLRFALQWVAHEDVAAQGNLATEASKAQFANLAARLVALRVVARGGGAGDGPPRLGVFVNGASGQGTRDPTDRENAFDLDHNNLTFGADYRFTDDLVAGVALAYTQTEVDFDSSKSVVGGDIESRGYALSAYATYDAGAFYKEIIASIGRLDFDMRRRITYPSNSLGVEGANETALSSTDGAYYALGLGAGMYLGKGQLSYGPYLRLSYVSVTIDGYREGNAGSFNLEIAEQEITSLVATAGARISRAFSVPFGVLVPYAWIEWNKEFEDYARTVRARYLSDLTPTFFGVVTDPPDSDYGGFAIGVSGVFRNDMQVFAQYEAVVSMEHIDDDRLIAGVRLDF